jgi:hypothetical protein
MPCHARDATASSSNQLAGNLLDRLHVRDVHGKDLVRVELAKLDTSAGSPDQLLEKYQANFTGASKPQGWSLMRCATESEAINP